MKDEELKSLKKLCLKDEALYAIYEQVEKCVKSPYYNTYMAIRKQVDDFNRQLTNNNIDLFAEAADKSFERSFKYMKEVYDTLEVLDKIRLKMTNDEQEIVVDLKKKPKGMGVAI